MPRLSYFRDIRHPLAWIGISTALLLVSGFLALLYFSGMIDPLLVNYGPRPIENVAAE